MLQYKTLINKILSQAVVSFVDWLTAVSTKGNQFLYWQFDSRTDSF